MNPQLARIFRRKIQVLPFGAKVALLATFVLAFWTYGYVFYYGFFKNHTSEMGFLESYKCPRCYGTSLCDDLSSQRAHLQGFSKLQFLNNLANLKNVNYGTYNRNPVVFKKLAHDHELAEFDTKYESKESLEFLSKRKNFAVQEIKVSDVIPSPDSWIQHSVPHGLSDLTLCPTPRLIDKMLFHYKEMNDAVDLSYPEKVQFATTLKINPEPIVLQTFQQADGWPFPKYYGACGRYVVVENAGRPLTEFYHATWEERVSYALQIMQIAEKFTNNDQKFSLYFTDVCYDNFAVNSDGRVMIIDAENIIVVDKWQIEKDKQPEWDIPHFSEFDTCDGSYGNCLTIHPQNLCFRVVSDFNYYAVCRDLLSSYASEREKPGGLLHDTPEDINMKYNIDELLRQCAKPNNPGDRLEVKDKLLKVLAEIKAEVF